MSEMTSSGAEQARPPAPVLVDHRRQQRSPATPTSLGAGSGEPPPKSGPKTLTDFSIETIIGECCYSQTGARLGVAPVRNQRFQASAGLACQQLRERCKHLAGAPITGTSNINSSSSSNNNNNNSNINSDSKTPLVHNEEQQFRTDQPQQQQHHQQQQQVAIAGKPVALVGRKGPQMDTLGWRNQQQAGQRLQPEAGGPITRRPYSRKYRAKNFQCPACKMAFSNNGQLKNHLRIHTGERPFQCEHSNCNKTFTRNEELTRHKLIHTGFRPHCCNSCGKRFGRKDHLKKHAKTHERKRARRRISRLSTMQQCPQADPIVRIDDGKIAENQLDKEFKFESKSANMSTAISETRVDFQAPVKHLEASMTKTTSTNTTNQVPFLTSSILTTMAKHQQAATPTTGSSNLTPSPPLVAFHPTLNCPVSNPTFLTNIPQPIVPINLPNFINLRGTQNSNAPIGSNANAIEEMALNCWNKWYNFFGLYRQQQVFAPSAQSRLGDGDNLFTKQ